MIDLSKLTPEPWEGVAQAYVTTLEPTGKYILAHNMEAVAEFNREADVDFCAVARRAFGIMMRRGWEPKRSGFTQSWCVFDQQFQKADPSALDKRQLYWPDPFTALCAAEDWYVANVEKKHEP